MPSDYLSVYQARIHPTTWPFGGHKQEVLSNGNCLHLIAIPIGILLNGRLVSPMRFNESILRIPYQAVCWNDGKSALSENGR